MSKYKTQYKSPKWQKKRLEILERDNYTCQYCLETEKQLHVHHKFYAKDFDIWDYPFDNAYITLCLDCHEIAHYNINLLNQTIAFIDYNVIMEFNPKKLNPFISELIELQDKSYKNINNG